MNSIIGAKRINMKQISFWLNFPFTAYSSYFHVIPREAEISLHVYVCVCVHIHVSECLEPKTSSSNNLKNQLTKQNLLSFQFSIFLFPRTEIFFFFGFKYYFYGKLRKF